MSPIWSRPTRPPERSTLTMEFTHDGYIFWSTKEGAAWWAFCPDGSRFVRRTWAEGLKTATDEEWEEGR